MRTVIFLAAYAISLILTLLNPSTTWASEDYLCELQLTAQHFESAQEALQRHFFNRPFSLFYAHEAREKAYRKLSLPEDITTEELDSLLLVAKVRQDDSAEDPLSLTFFQWAENNPGPMARITFPSAEPFLWKTMKSAQAAPEYPSKKVGLTYDRAFAIGYLSDPDSESVRHYLAVRGENDLYVDVTIGLDVPCSAASDYTWEDVRDLEHIITPGLDYCRVPVLSFSRIERLKF